MGEARSSLGLTELDFHAVVDSQIREFIEIHVDILARVHPELSKVPSRIRTDKWSGVGGRREDGEKGEEVVWGRGASRDRGGG